LATVLINLLTCVVLLLALQARLGGLPLRAWGLDTFKLVLSAAGAGLLAWGLSVGLVWPENLIGRGLQVSRSGSLGFLFFVVFGQALGVPEVSQISGGLRRRLIRR